MYQPSDKVSRSPTSNITPDIKVENFSKNRIKPQRLYTNLVHFKRFYAITNFKTKLLIAVTLGVLTALLAAMLIESTGLYAGGTSAFFQGIARIAYVCLAKSHSLDDTALNARDNLVFNFLFWGLYLIMNICFAVFAYQKIGKQFTILSIVFITVTQLCGFAFGSIFEHFHWSFNLFGTTATIDDNLAQFHVKCVLFDTKWFPTLVPSPGGIHNDWTRLLLWNNDTKHEYYGWIENAGTIRSLSLIIYAVIYGIVTAAVDAILYIIGGSSAGSDFITVYLSKEKNMSIGVVFTMLNMIFMFLGVLLGTFISAGLVSKNYFDFNTFLSGNFIGSFCWVLTTGIFIDVFFPRQKTASVKVYTNNYVQIARYLKSINFPHAIVYSADKTIGDRDQGIMETRCLYFELPKLVQSVRKFDPDCLIESIQINDIDGTVHVEQTV